MNDFLFIRADAGKQIGTGHVMRCLAVAEAWIATGRTAHFIMSEPGELRSFLKEKGFPVTVITNSHPSSEDLGQTLAIIRQQPASWVVVDGYNFDESYIHAFQEVGCQLMCIEDQPRLSRYACDILLDQNFGAERKSYESSLRTKKLLGPRYALIRREFRSLTESTRRFEGCASRILVCMGGADPLRLSERSLRALATPGVMPSDSRVRMVVGPCNPHVQAIEKLSKVIPRCEVYIDVRSMQDHLAWTDLGVISGGGTLWEMLYKGIPVLSFSVNEKQTEILQHLDNEGVIQYAGSGLTITDDEIGIRLRGLIRNGRLREQYSQKGKRLVDGQGAERVVGEMLTLDDSSATRLRDLVDEDVQRSFSWVADQEFQRLFLLRVPPTPETHKAYFNRIRNDSTQRVFAIETAGKYVGNCGIKNITSKEGEIWIYIGESNWRGKGIGKRGLELLIHQGFEELNLKTLYLHVAAFNRNAIGLYASLGFQVVGLDNTDNRWAAYGDSVVKMCLKKKT